MKHAWGCPNNDVASTWLRRHFAGVEIVTRSDRPELHEAADVVFRERWPESISHDDVPMRYMGRGEEYFALEGREAGIEPTCLSFMAVAVGSSYDKCGMAGVVLEELARRAHSADLTHVVAPPRPTWKHRYPMVPMADGD